MARPKTSEATSAPSEEENKEVAEQATSTPAAEAEASGIDEREAALAAREAELAEREAALALAEQAPEDPLEPAKGKELFQLGTGYWDGNRMHERGDRLYFEPDKAPNRSVCVRTGKAVKRENRDINVR